MAKQQPEFSMRDSYRNVVNLSLSGSGEHVHLTTTNDEGKSHKTDVVGYDDGIAVCSPYLSIAQARLLAEALVEWADRAEANQ